MTVQEAVGLLDDLVGMIEDNRNSDFDKAFKMAIESLEEKIAMNVIEQRKLYGAWDVGRCPRCNVVLRWKSDYCGKCGQRIKWGD